MKRQTIKVTALGVALAAVAAAALPRATAQADGISVPACQAQSQETSSEPLGLDDPFEDGDSHAATVQNLETDSDTNAVDVDTNDVPVVDPFVNPVPEIEPGVFVDPGTDDPVEHLDPYFDPTQEEGPALWPGERPELFCPDADRGISNEAIARD